MLLSLESLRRALDLDPDDPRVLFNLAVLYARDGELRQSADAYRHVLAAAPDYADAYLGLARVLVQDSRDAEARVILREFITRFPRSPERERAQAALDELVRMGSGRP